MKLSLYLLDPDEEQLYGMMLSDAACLDTPAAVYHEEDEAQQAG